MIINEGTVVERRTLKSCVLDMKSQRAWEVTDKDGKNKRLIFADSELGAVKRSNMRKDNPEKVFKVQRAEYADGLKYDVYTLVDVMRTNGWAV